MKFLHPERSWLGSCVNRFFFFFFLDLIDRCLRQPPHLWRRLRLQGKACTPPTDAEVAGLRAASEYLLLAASAQVLAATMALLVPAWPVAVLGSLVGCLTAYRATDVLWMLVACHDSPHGALAFHFWLYYAVLWAAFAVAVVVSLH